MTDEEILENLKKADAFLEEYKKLAKPVAEELAQRKSMAVFGKPGLYTGNLGCWESGIDFICLHITDEGHAELGARHVDDPRMDKVREFEDEWAKRAKPRHVYIGGHY